MGDVVNLRLARKRAARAADDEQAARNRAAHGRPKAERELEFSARPLVEGMEQTLEYEIRELQRGKAPT